MSKPRLRKGSELAAAGAAGLAFILSPVASGVPGAVAAPAPDVVGKTTKVGCVTTELVAAINAANATPASDTLVLAKKCTYTLSTRDNSYYGWTGLPVVTTPIVVIGRGASIVRSGAAPSFRIAAVAATGDLTLRAVTLSGGLAQGGDGGSDRGTSDNGGGGGGGAGLGGAVYNQGTLRLVVSTLSNNAARGGNGGDGALNSSPNDEGGGGGGGGLGGNGGASGNAADGDGGAGGGGWGGNGGAVGPGRTPAPAAAAP